MLEIINALCQLNRKLSKVILEEEDPIKQLELIELCVLLSETISRTPIDLKFNTGNKHVVSIAEEIKASENIIDECIEKTRPIENLFDSLTKIMDELLLLILNEIADQQAPGKDF